MKRLYKSNKDKMIAGVCGGIAEYFDIDPVLVRLVFIILFFVGFTSVLAYIIAVFIMPEKPRDEAEAGSTTHREHVPVTDKPVKKAPSGPSKSSLIFGIILVTAGAFFLMDNIPFLHPFHNWIYWNFSDYIVPAIFIILGLILVSKGTGNGKKKEDEKFDSTHNL